MNIYYFNRISSVRAPWDAFHAPFMMLVRKMHPTEIF